MSLENIIITSFAIRDLRWPTSLDKIGSDPMNLAGENSFGYLQYHSNLQDLTETRWSFANGQGNDFLYTTIQSLAPRLVGRSLASITSNIAGTQRKLQSRQIYFMSPECSVLQLCTCAVLNAVWDLWSKAVGKPLQKLVADFSPEEFVWSNSTLLETIVKHHSSDPAFTKPSRFTNPRQYELVFNMAGLLEIIPLIGETIEAASVEAETAAATGEVVAGSTEAAAGATEAAAEATDAGAISADAGGTAADAGGTAGSRVPVFDMTASGTTAGANAARQAIVDGAVSFAQWAATQAVKQAVFYAGMKSAEALFHAVAGSATSTDPAPAQLVAKFETTNNAVVSLHATTSGWIQWSKDHYNSRASYGSVTVMGSVMTDFEIFQFNISAVTDLLSTDVAPALLAYNTCKSPADLDTLRAKLLIYYQKVKAQSKASPATRRPWSRTVCKLIRRMSPQHLRLFPRRYSS
ncbi:hypothetical protein QQX98_008036 [Neonectria punicea]|uniref:Uncharacterized protein n=1 Tax=Neonectria punicea TaxID=979145 RepID=A0ABR1GWM9_9HYPO